MGRALDEVLAALPKAQRARVEARTKVLLEEVETYQAVRRVAPKARADAARALKLPATSAKQLACDADAYLSALRRHVEAMGGTLDLVLHLPPRAPVQIERLGDLVDDDVAAPRPVKRQPAKAKAKAKVVPAAA